MPVTLKTTPREKVGSRWARRLRMQGQIPATIQGDGANLNICIDEVEFLAARRHHEHVFELALADKKEPAMVTELQYDAFGDSIVHVEFHRVDLHKETESEVELEFIGHPKGGVLNHLMTHVTVAAIPAKIPDKIEVRVDELEVGGEPLTAADLEMPEGVRLVTELETPLANVSTVRAEEAATPEEGEGEAEVGEAAEGAPAKEGEEKSGSEES